VQVRVPALPVLVVAAALCVAAGPVRAASVDESASSLGANDFVDASEDGVLAVALQLDTVAPLTLAVRVAEPEKAAPLVLELLLSNQSPERLASLALALGGGATFADTGAVGADDAPTTDGVTGDATSALVVLAGDRRPYTLELGDAPGGGAGWRIDASPLPADTPFELTITPVPEPAPAALGAAALLALAGLARRRPGRVAPLLLLLALGGPARAETRIVSDPVDGSFGSLRQALEVFASAGDTIVFQTSDVVLEDVLEIPADLDGLTIQGPVTIRPAEGLRAVIEILADQVTIEGGIVFQDTQISTPSLSSRADITIQGNTFLGTSLVSFRRDVRCRFLDNTMDVALVPGSRSNPISLALTADCLVEGNDITTDEWASIEEDNSDQLLIRDNDTSTGILSRQRSGRIEENRAEFVFVVPNDGLPSEPLLVARNTADWMRVHRTAVEIVDNTVDALEGGGSRLARIGMSLVNGDARGGVGSFSARENTITGGRLSLLYVDDDGEAVPGELLDNEISSCRSRGLFASRPKGTRILRNQVTGCGTAPTQLPIGIALKRPAALPVLVEDNTVSDHTGDGIAVQAPTTTVTLRANVVSDASMAGIILSNREGPPVEIEDGSVTRSGGPGLWVLAESRASVAGGEYRDNGDAGILLLPDTQVSISRVGMSDNAGPGIDLFPAEVTPNDQPKTANADLDWPENLRLDVPTQKIEGDTLPDTRVEGYVVEGDPRAGNPQNGEGTLFQAAVTADAMGHFVYPAEGALDCPAAAALTFTATRADGLTTSEFSPDFDCDEPPLDSDGDSVTDDRDQCPDTPEGTPVDADGCPIETDADGDGVEDPDDECPGTPDGTPVEANGCATNVTLDDGREARCNDPSTCFVGPTGGSCNDCGIRDPGGADFRCFDPSAGCFAVAEGGTGCLDCDAVAYGASFDCQGGECVLQPGGDALVCEGPALACPLALPGGGADQCPADRGCGLIVLPSVGGTGTPSSFTIGKTTSGGDGEFPFYFTTAPEAGVAAAVSLPIATSSGSGVRLLRAWFGIDLAFTEATWVEELPGPEWSLAGIECDGVGLERSAFGFDGVAGVFDPGDDLVCTLDNAKSGPPTVRTDLGVLLPEVVERSHTFGLPAGHRVTIAGSNGFVVVDALTGDVPFAGNTRLSFLSQFEPPATGAVVFENPDGSGEDTWLKYSPGGTAQRQYFEELNGFGFTLLGNRGLTDLHHDGSDPAAPEAVGVEAGFRNLKEFFYTDQFDPGTFTLSSTTFVNSFDFSQVTTLSPISAYRFGDSLFTLVAMDGEPGELILVERDPGGALTTLTLLGALENGPRRVRCAPGACAVSNFASDSLSIATWDGAGTAAVVGHVAVGDGPVGISARPFGANVLVASTGFFDDSIWLTEIAQDGSVVSNTSLAAPTGCTQPGHALWLRDADESLVVTCNGSSAYAVLTPGPLPPE